LNTTFYRYFSLHYVYISSIYAPFGVIGEPGGPESAIRSRNPESEICRQNPEFGVKRGAIRNLESAIQNQQSRICSQNPE